MALNSVKDDEKLEEVSRLKTLIRLLRYLLDYKKIIAIVFLIMTICTGVSLINPLIIEYAIDNCIVKKNVFGLKEICMVALVVNTVSILLIKLRMYLMAKMSNDILVKIRQELYMHIQTLSFEFFDSRPTGKILARVVGDVNSLKDVLSNCVTTFLPDFFTIIAVVIIMFAKNYKLALASLSTLPFMIIGVWFIQTHAHKLWQINKKKNSNLNAFLHEDLSGMRVIQSLTAEEERKKDFKGLLKEQRDSFVKAITYSDAFGSIIDFCWGIASAFMFFVAVKMVKDGNLYIGTIIAFETYISMFWRPVMNLSNFYNQLITNLAGAERIFEMMDIEPNIENLKEAKILPEIKGEVEFENVTFSYDDSTDVLKDLSFKIKPGETIALVGPTGAGKTTIVSLISRFYDTTNGSVKIDGYDVKDVTVESLRSQMGVMTQDNFLFSGTIKDNIAYGKLGATDEEIENAAKAVNVHDFIMKLEKGYDTEIKERGSGLSIGQKQLIAFARTMLSMPKILILDEATSSIDTHTELLVQKGIETLLQGRTSFVIAHRLSTIQKADRIFVVDACGIVEEGTAKELLDKKGEYYKLYMSQFKNIA